MVLKCSRLNVCEVNLLKCIEQIQDGLFFEGIVLVTCLLSQVLSALEHSQKRRPSLLCERIQVKLDKKHDKKYLIQ